MLGMVRSLYPTMLVLTTRQPKNMSDTHRSLEDEKDRPLADSAEKNAWTDVDESGADNLAAEGKASASQSREADVCRASPPTSAFEGLAPDVENPLIGATAASVGQDVPVRSTEARLTLQSNWLAALDAAGKPGLEAFEYPLYSDVHVAGEIVEGLGPYKLLNALPLRADGSVAIAVILRATFYEVASWPGALPRTLKTNVDRYHGGTFADEFAALCSLSMGVRLKAGDANRRFGANDPMGRFQAHQSRVPPTLVLNRSRAIVPSAFATPPLASIGSRLRTIPFIEPRLLTELMRAARAYQDALWIAESEPNLAWLLLVSALEIAASAHVSDTGSAEGNLREYQPALAALLASKGGDELVAEVGGLLKNLYSATKKFMRFCEQFAPPPPDVRPNLDWMRIEWAWPKLKKVLAKVYEHRSHALHAGIPFPAPMCRAPERWGEEGAVSERAVTALAESTLGATWTPGDAPISLNTFQYFVRASLLLWWDHISAPVQHHTGVMGPQ